jgi:hypothetical protein
MIEISFEFDGQKQDSIVIAASDANKTALSSAKRAGESALISGDTVSKGAEAKACNPNAVNADAVASNESYEYSGRHDHGSLPTLKSEGPNTLIVLGLQQAKMRCEEFFTEKIEEAKGASSSNSGDNDMFSSAPPVKKKK